LCVECVERKEEVKNKERTEAVVKELLFGKADRFTRQPFETGA
jgi:hypothetical protein